MRLDPLAALLLLGITTGPLPTARADTRVHLEGGVRPVAPFDELAPGASLFNAPGDEVGPFTLDASAPELDFRVAPGVLVIMTPTGTLAAHGADPSVLYGVLPRDPESDRPLDAEAPEGATCPTGAEPDCWVAGDSIPTDVEVADALGGFLRPATPALFSTTSISAESQALLGCGPFWGTDCATAGIDLRFAGTSVLVQAWPSIGASPPALTPFDSGPGRADFPGAQRPDGAARLVAPYTGGGAAFATSLAALSWNHLMTLVAASGDGQPPIEPGEFDPLQPLTAEQCSFATPQYCSSVLVFLLFATNLLGDDPNAPPTGRLLWQAGALYDVTDATGDLAAYAGGTVHVLGLERARGDFATYGVPLVLFPAGATLDPATPFAFATPVAPEAPRFGLAYATVPEPSTTALGVGVVAILTALRFRFARRA